MKTVYRYLSREIYTATVFVLLALVGLFVFFDLVNELGDVGQRGYQAHHALRLVLISVPGRMYELMPVAALIGSIYALAQLAASSEFTIMRVSGMGARRALWTLARIGLPVVLLTFVIGEYVAPYAERYGQDLRLRYKDSVTSGKLRSGFWFRDAVRQGSGAVKLHRYINVARVAANATALDLTVYEFDPEFRLVSIMSAKEGRFEQGAWKLKNVVETRFMDPSARAGAPTIDQLLAGEVSQADTQRVPYAVEVREAERHWISELTPSILATNLLAPDRMSAQSLVTYLRYLEQNRQSTGRYEIALWKKFIFPVGVWVMMALALPFAYMKVRSGGVSFKIFSGVMLGIGFYTLNQLFSHLALINTWPPALAVALPSVTVLALALVTLRWVERH
jgi:lipopolysaccharide export system permease protein